MSKILAVDDEKEILNLIRNTLRKDGHDVTCVQSMEELKENQISKYDLILLDVMMQDIDGYTICKKIRGNVDCPIVFLTAKSLDEDVDFGFSVGADDYIKKPFSIVELRARVNAHIRREQREKHQCMLASGVRFFLKEKEVQIDETRIYFTKSEYEICELLARSPGQVYSKEQIYVHVFGYEGESDVSAITEHIKNIRKKFLEVGAESQMIETVWGIGYRWR
ncbi:response regulator transcription factor [Lachnospiraceae bacterium LCP25S3_G4]